MKIEIELEELTFLRNDLSNLQKENRELERKLEELDEKELKEKARRLAIHLFNCYAACAFRKAGLVDTWEPVDISLSHLEGTLGKQWYKKEDFIKVEISAYISESVKRGFLKIGVNMPDVEKEKDYEL